MAKLKPDLVQIFGQGQAEAARNAPPQPKTRRAFVSAPPGVDISVLRDAIEGRGIAVYALSDVQGHGRTTRELLKDCLDRADLVVVVITQPDNDHFDGVLGLFDLGFAAALDKRTLTLIPPGGEVPIADIPYMKAKPDTAPRSSSGWIRF